LHIAAAVLDKVSPPRRRPERRLAGTESDPVAYGPLIVPELAEAASRTGDVASW
jgi:hypothetical protein